MITGLVAMVAAWLTTLALTPVVRRIALRAAIVDSPDGHRKLQKQPVPMLGGVAVVLGWWTAVAALRIFDPHFVLPGLAMPTMVSLAILATIGVLDDVFRLRARWKLLGQAIAVVPIVMSGCQLHSVELGGYAVDLGMLSIPATLLWLVLGINSLNLLDGMDGMATVVSAGIALTLAAVCGMSGQETLAVLIFPLVGSLLGFLTYNFPPARIYMGDAGSMVLGLAVSQASLLAAKADGSATNLTLLAGIMAIPLADTSLAIVRRSLSGFGFWHPDRAHIHHRLLDQGLSAKQVLAVFSLLAAAWGVVVVAAAAWNVQWPIWCGAAIVGTFSVHFHLAGQHEWTMFTRRLGALPIANFGLPSQAQLAGMSPDAAWQNLLTRMRGLPIVSVMRIVEDATGRTTQRGWSDMVPAESCSAIEVQARSAGNRRCRLRIESSDLAVGATWSRIPQLLDRFAQFWADHPETADVAVLPYEAKEALVPRPAAATAERQQKQAA